jgi:hypothetical protein
MSQRDVALAVGAELVFFSASFLAAAGGLQLVWLAGILPDPGRAVWVGPVAGPLVMAGAGGVYAWLERRGDRALQRLIRQDRPALRTAWAVAGIHLSLALAGSVAIAVVLQWLGVPAREQENVAEIIAAGFSPALVLLGVAALAAAPVAEEWLFRGLLFRRLARAGPLVLAYPLSAGLFALVHLNPSGVPTYLWLGLVFADAYRRTGRLWVASLVHFGNNAATLAFLLAGF